MSALPALDMSTDGEPSDDALRVGGLNVALAGRSVDVVADVTFALQRGEILGLVGESGSGKTTVALALLGFARTGLSIRGGSVQVGGQDVLVQSDSARRRLRGGTVSYVPQDPSSSLNPGMRIHEQLTDVLREHRFGADRRARRQRVREMLEEVGLPSDDEFVSRYPHQLSGGQQQRVAIAMAFACRPAVVVLDEPTTGLDVTTQATVLRTVRQLAQSHQSAAVYVSHDLAVVASVSNYIAVMYAGRLIEHGPTVEIVTGAAHPYTRRLIAAVPRPQQRRALVGIPGHVPPLGQRSDGCTFASRCTFVEDACRTGSIPEDRVSARHAVICRRWKAVRGLVDEIPAAGALPSATTTVATRRQATTLKVSGLDVWYGKKQVLFGADLAIRHGECLALVGESGSGKTTMARTISGLHTQAKGELSLNDEIVPWGARRRSAELRRCIQYIFQNPYGSLNPRKTIRELLELPMREFGLEISRHAVAELLEQVSLSPAYAGRYPAQLSGGERQRVAIARALAVSPEVLICDEITSALDVSVQASILALLGRLHTERALTVLFVTHNLAVVRAIADDVVVLHRGKVVETGPVDEMLDHPKDAYTQRLIEDTPGFA